MRHILRSAREVLAKEKFMLGIKQLENWKDELLNALDSKPEKSAKLEKDITQKSGYVAQLEDNIRDLKQPISLAVDGTSIKEQKLRSVSSEFLNLKAELKGDLKGI